MALSSVLPFVTAPLIYFTCLNKYIIVQSGIARFRINDAEETALFSRRSGRTFGSPSGQRADVVEMANSWWLAIKAIAVWLVIAAIHVTNLVLLGLGQA